MGWVNPLKLVAAFAVICIHVTGPVYEQFGNVPISTWWLANVINAFSRFAVPIFVMISGALLLGKAHHIQEFYQKRGTRIVLPLLAWSLIYIAFRASGGEGVIHATLSSLVNGKAYGHLWFLTLYLWLILYMPFVSKGLLGLRFQRQDWQIMGGLMLLTATLVWFSSLAKHLMQEKVTVFMHFPSFFIYLVLGFLISRHSHRIRLSISTLLGFFLGINTAAALINYWICEKFSTYLDYLVLNNLSPLTMVATASLFCIFCKLARPLSQLPIPSQLAQCTFGIYLVHPLLLKGVVNKLAFFDAMPGSLALTGQILVTFLMSLAVIYAVRQSPMGRSIC